ADGEVHGTIAQQHRQLGEPGHRTVSGRAEVVRAARTRHAGHGAGRLAVQAADVLDADLRRDQQVGADEEADLRRDLRGLGQREARRVQLVRDRIQLARALDETNARTAGHGDEEDAFLALVLVLLLLVGARPLRRRSLRRLRRRLLALTTFLTTLGGLVA